jgi:plasmid stabilization system protein ParE
MPRVIVTPRADADIVAILDYLTRTAGTRVAAKYADTLDAAIAGLEDMPGTAAPRPALGPNMRITVVKSFTSCEWYTAGATSQPKYSSRLPPPLTPWPALPPT